MWMHHALIALDVATDRAREADAEVRRRQLERELRDGMAGLPHRPSRWRGVLAAPVRLSSTAMHGFSELTCTLATRIEGRSA